MCGKTYDPATQRFELPPEQAFALANPDGPVFFPGAMQLALATLKAEPRIIERFKTGKGLGWHEYDPEFFHGTERFFRPNYIGNLVSNWIPALDGVEDKLKSGAKVADVGCGHGASTILMATAFPKSQFIGFDYHRPRSNTREGSLRCCVLRRRARRPCQLSHACRVDRAFRP